MKIVNTEEMRHLERAADASGASYAQMMESAGRAVALTCQKALDVANRPVLVLIGPGNNGGDGLVAARYLAQAGAVVTCYIWKRDIDEDGNFTRVEELGCPVMWAAEDEGLASLHQQANEAEVTIDALLGTGMDRPISGTLRDLLEVVGETTRQRKAEGPRELVIPSFPSPCSSKPPIVIAVDVPSGVNCDSGAVDAVTLPADLTVTFGCPKVGQLRFPAAEMVGQFMIADIGIPSELLQSLELELATGELICDLLPRRPLNAHKGTFGRALLVVGSVNYTGAAYLAGAAATRVGAGLVTLALAGPLHSIIASKLTEATYLILPHELGVITPQAIGVLVEMMGSYDALLLGPGLTQEEPTAEFVQRFLGLQGQGRKGRIGFHAVEEEPERQLQLPPLVIDADGLNILSHTEDGVKCLPPETILTPHPGELSRLTGRSVADINDRRIETAREFAREWNQVVVLKGAFTVVASPEGRVVVQPFANPGLASAGTGDVLAGTIVGLRAQGLGSFEAAVAGAYLHGLAGQLAQEQLGDTGMVAGDLIPRLPLAIRWLRNSKRAGDDSLPFHHP